MIVGSSVTESGRQAFKWTQINGMEQITNVLDSNLKESWAYNISANGRVIVGSGDQGMGWESYKGFIWIKENRILNVNSFKELPRYEIWAASADGSVLVGDGGKEAFRWALKNGLVNLGVLPQRNNSRAISVSADGSVVVGSSYNLPSWDNEQAFRWTQNEGMIGLGFLPGSNYSFANVVSSNGSVVAGTSSDSTGYPAFRWTKENGMIRIDHLPGRNTTHPFGINYDGSIIVGTSFKSLDQGTAFIWDNEHGMQSLQKMLSEAYRLNLQGWDLQSANCISPDGRIIVGWGINPSGNKEAFRVILKK